MYKKKIKVRKVFKPSTKSPHPLCSNRSESKFRSAIIENTIESVEENISVNALGSTTNGLKSSKAGLACVVDWSEVDQLSWDGGVGSGTDAEGDIWKGGSAREDVSSVGRIEGRTLHLSVIGGNGRVEHEEESSSGVCDSSGSTECVGGSANLVRGRWELPETSGRIDWSVSDGTSVVVSVDSTKVISTICVQWEVRSKERVGERGLGVVEESLLLGWGNCDSLECHARYDLMSINLPVLMLLNERPRSPSEVSWTNWVETLVASSTAWPLTAVLPTVTVSVPTVPEAPDPSAYVIFQEAPVNFLKVLLEVGLKTLCPDWDDVDNEVEKTHL